MVIETIEDKKEILRASINLIWKATDGKVTSITFNQTRSATVKIGDVSNELSLNAPDVVLISEKNFGQLIKDLNKGGPVIIEDSPDTIAEIIDEVSF